MAKSIQDQFQVIQTKTNKVVDTYMEKQLVDFGIHMVNEALPSQQEFRNLTGNTLTSYAFGVYVNGSLRAMGFNKDAKAPLRNKLIKDEIVYDFTDYDGNFRDYFRAEVDTDAGYGQSSSVQFLQSYKSRAKYSIIFTTGTEYSAYLENSLNLNVLSDGFDYAASAILKSFKPIR